MSLERRITAVQRQIQNYEENLQLIELRKSEYPLATEIPLNILKQEKKTKEMLEKLYNDLDALKKDSQLNPTQKPIPDITTDDVPKPGILVRRSTRKK